LAGGDRLERREMEKVMGGLMARFRRAVGWRFMHDERGLSTAELLGNAALAIAALVVIWAALETLGVDVVNWIRSQIMGGSAGS
jgi:hypothetical protein